MSPLNWAKICLQYRHKESAEGCWNRARCAFCYFSKTSLLPQLTSVGEIPNHSSILADGGQEGRLGKAFLFWGR